MPMTLIQSATTSLLNEVDRFKGRLAVRMQKTKFLEMGE
jgi:hypothetical protein